MVEPCPGLCGLCYERRRVGSLLGMGWPCNWEQKASEQNSACPGQAPPVRLNEFPVEGMLCPGVGQKTLSKSLSVHCLLWIPATYQGLISHCLPGTASQEHRKQAAPALGAGQKSVGTYGAFSVWGCLCQHTFGCFPGLGSKTKVLVSGKPKGLLAWGGKAVSGSNAIICNHLPTLLFNQTEITNWCLCLQAISWKYSYLC